MDEWGHKTVLLDESVGRLLNGRTKGLFIDATLGGGGTSKKILGQLDASGRLIGIDQDPEAIELSKKRLSKYPNFTAVCANFRDLDTILRDADIDEIDGIIFDLGISSMQVDNPARGFSFKNDFRLDMRMDCDKTKTSAYDLLNSIDEASLRKLFYEFGQDRWSGRVASRIVKHRRESGPIETTAELAKLISQAIPRKFHSRRIHPATRFFQALRIAVNQEMDALQEGLNKAIRLLAVGGRIVVISYHSLEDRIVKHAFRREARETKTMVLIDKKPLTPEPLEIEQNPRSRSAKMRTAEKI